MKLAQVLGKYREYHRDHRNVATHAVGIPLIVLAVEVLLARPAFAIAGLVLTPAMIASVLAAVFYLRLDLRTGALMALLLTLFAWLGHVIAWTTTTAWLGGGIGLFVLGWVFQLLGHKYEGRKPAFIDDLKSLLVGPLFVMVEGLFALGLLGGLKREVEGE